MTKRIAKPPATPTVHLVATPGGHLDLLLALRSAFDGFRRIWVVSPGSSADALYSEGEEVRTLPRFHGLSASNARLSGPSLRLALRERPRLIVTTGSGSVVPFCLASKALGSKMLFVETMARITNASRAGKVLSRFADRTIAQWPEMLRMYPDAEICKPVLLDQTIVDAAPRTSGSGTFVAVGTHIDPFDRILSTVERAVREGLLPEPAWAQTGVCDFEPTILQARRWLSPDEMDASIREARYFVCHAGSGLISRALNSDLRPMVVPRLAHLGEHVDDHQEQITERLGRLGLVVPVKSAITPEHIAAVDAPHEATTAGDAFPDMQPTLVEMLTQLQTRRL